MKRFVCLFVQMLFVVLLFSVVLSAQEFKIQPGKPLLQTLKSGETYTYKIELKTGDFVHCVVLQQGVDVVVRLFAPDGKQIVERDAPNSTAGEESLSVVAENGGAFLLQVKMLDDKAALGNYSITLDKPRPPNDRDFLRIKAETIFAAAQVLQQNPEATENLKQAAAKFDEAAQDFARLDSIYWQAFALEVGGGVRSTLQDFAEAKSRYEKSLALYVRLKDEQKQIELLNVVGVLHSDLKDSARAVEFYTESAALAEKAGNKAAQALALTNRGSERLGLKDDANALADYETALALQKSAGNLKNAAQSLEQIVGIYDGRKDNAKTIAADEELLALYRQLQDREQEAETLNEFGVFYGENKNRQKAVELQTESLKIWRELKNKSEEARVLKNLAINTSESGDKAKAIDFYNQAVAALEENNQPGEAADVLDYVAGLYTGLKQPEKVIAAYEEQIKLYREAKNVKGEAVALNRIGTIDSNTFNDLTKARRYFDRALVVIRTIDDKPYEAQILYNSAVSLTLFSEFEKALTIYEQVLMMRRAQKDRIGEADTLGRIGQVYSRLQRNADDYAKALENLQEALKIYRAEKNKYGEINTLGEIGGVYGNSERFSQAVEILNAALLLARENKEKTLEADILHNLSLAYSSVGDIAQRLEYERQTLPIYQSTENKLGETAALNEIGQTYNQLGNYEQALIYFQKALVLARQTGEPDREAGALSRIASVLLSTGDYKNSIKYSEESLPLFRALKDRDSEATATLNIGNAYGQLYDTEKSLEYVQSALDLSRETGNLGTQSTALQGIAMIYYINEDYAKSFDYLQQALPLARALNQRETEASLFSNLMKLFKYQNKPRAAIFYGKQSVNLYQQIRATLKNVDKDLQQSYLKSNEDKYRNLADLLIQVGRLPEAQAVLGMLKQEEYSEFVQRGEGEAAKLLGNIEMSPDETAAVARYEKIADTLTAKGAEYEKLKKLRPATPAEQAELKTKIEIYKADLDAASRYLDVVLRQIEAEFSKPDTKTDVVATLQANKGLQSDLKTWKLPNTVFLSTVVGENNYYVILTTPTVQIAGKTPIKAADLNKLVQDFRDAVQNPCACIDPQPLGKKLYDVLVKPIETNLAELEKQANGKPLTLAWSLDGSLRYLPLAALWDGKEYLAQKYQNVLFTLASRTRLPLQPSAEWRGLGLGVTQAWRDFPALASVKDELLQGAIHDDGNAASKGVVPGRVLLDKQFNEANLASELGGGYTLVHIASHFSLKPGNDSQSYLLLGDGTELSLDKIRHSPDFKFDGVELLTLSACNTAAGGSGKEVEGLAYAAQDNGAMAVLATLWSVADESTQSLMSEFYRQRQEKHLTKAEALREAQLALLNGAVKADGNQVRRSKLGEMSGQNASGAPFKTNSAKPFAHPFFWSPFVLIGNWR